MSSRSNWSKETRQPLPAEPGQPARYDDKYQRAGTAVNSMLTEPLGGRCKVSVRATKTALDLAEEVKILARYRLRRCRSGGPGVGQSEHPTASLYKAFPPQEARRLLDRLEIHYTPQGARVRI